ncbi:hypothetical protein [Alkalicoccobacillus murimartini]|uniref:Uncharacterized protein n=1 Tax=Alkalicoccobacillus murimartini TaxID=171685 RepID=A0ABT9YCP1_9BACI|nr:hypothetical protein [Alkalicoccobacillus murimartini]MDQ0205393.1 hypothetical protein [Alkalicoccobacillus murimartini]
MITLSVAIVLISISSGFSHRAQATDGKTVSEYTTSGKVDTGRGKP